jgi:NAD(P)-dependent dehydrogenase (short-subunit alcohol dehydrogenase family)
MGPKGLALVTGGNRGIGFETTTQLAEAGFTVLIGARNRGRVSRIGW